LTNQAALSGTLIEKKAMRYTPAGLPVIEVRLMHDSTVTEAATPRSVQFEVKAKAIGEAAERLATIPLGQQIRAHGFLAPARLHSNQLNFHLTNFDLE
jgi:primosomal replication protein N